MQQKSRLPYGRIYLTFFYFFTAFTLGSGICSAQFKTAVAGKEYDRSGFHNFFWGKHYRKEWATPVRVKMFYLDSAKGGLKPVQENGSRQSLGLRLEDKEGKQYVLRSIDKDFRNGLPNVFRGTFISHVAKDQASIGYPFAALSLTPMMEAAGIYHTIPEAVFVPHQDALGEYNKKYGDQLYLFEERPDDDNEGAVHFGYAKKIIGSEKLYEHLYEDNDNAVDQKAFAKARLFDMLIGDWGRHADQWRWAAFKEGDKTLYRPIPRDRDQSYTKFDGLYPLIGTKIIGPTQLESFDNDIDNVPAFNTPGRRLDRQFTNQLTEQQWVAIATELQQALTDSVIQYGMHQLPAEIFAINGEKIFSDLKTRRNHLQEYAKNYYKFLARQIYIPGSDKKELFEINRINENETEISVYKIKKDTEKELMFSRTFDKRESSEIFIYGFKGKDIFNITGNSSEGVKIRIIGVTKSDTLLHDIPEWNHAAKIYRGKSNNFDTATFQKHLHLGPFIFIAPSAYKVYDDDPIQLFTRTGLRIGINLDYHMQPWKRDQLEYRQMISVNYGVLRKTFNVQYLGIFPQLVGKWDLLLKGRYDNPAIENFFGIGNETKIKNDDAYYVNESTRWFGGIGLARDFSRYNHVELTTFYQHVNITRMQEHIIPDRTFEGTDYPPKKFAGIEGGYNFRKTDNEKYPMKGMDFSIGVGYVRNLSETDKSFYKINSALAFYIPLGKSLSFAIRAGAGTISGDADYYHMNKLSGNTNLRGFARDRFYGKTNFYNNSELRWLTNTHNYFFGGKIGLMAFIDNGRIWQPLEISNTWHTGYGGGLILIPFNKIVLTGTYGMSEEGNRILLKASLFF